MMGKPYIHIYVMYIQRLSGETVHVISCDVGRSSPERRIGPRTHLRHDSGDAGSIAEKVFGIWTPYDHGPCHLNAVEFCSGSCLA